MAVGTEPYRPDYIPFNDTCVFDSDGILELSTLPRSITVIGAGVIGIEYATIFNSLDVHVTLVEPRDSMLDFIDEELINDFIYQLRDRGMVLRFGEKAETVEYDKQKKCRVKLEGGRTITSDVILFRRWQNGCN